MSPKFSLRKVPGLGTARGWAAIAFGESRLDLATGRAAGDHVDIVHQTSATVPAENGTDPTTRWQSAADSLRGSFDPSEHHIVTAVSSEDVLCQTLRLPTADNNELKQMLDLQIDSLTPLQLEDVVYSFEPLEIADNQTRVFVAVARKDAVNERVAALENAGMPAELVSVDMLAMFRGLTRRNLLPRDGNLNALVVLSKETLDIIIHSRSIPITVRSIFFGADWLVNPENDATVREELQRTLVAAQAENSQSAPGDVTFFAPTEAARLVAERLAPTLAMQSHILTDGSLPPVAANLCTESAVAGGRPLNLLPDEWRERRRRAKVRRHLVRGSIALLSLYMIALGVFLLLMAVRRTQLSSVESDKKKIAAEFNSSRLLHSELVAMRKQLDTKFSALEVLRETSTRIPENLMKLSYFLFKKDQNLALRGQAQSAEMAYDFISRLEQCELFSSVKTVAVRTEGAAGLTKFEVLGTLKSAAGTTGAPNENK